jgi:hypothetical protein
MQSAKVHLQNLLSKPTEVSPRVLATPLSWAQISSPGAQVSVLGLRRANPALEPTLPILNIS